MVEWVVVAMVEWPVTNNISALAAVASGIHIAVALPMKIPTSLLPFLPPPPPPPSSSLYMYFYRNLSLPLSPPPLPSPPSLPLLFSVLPSLHPSPLLPLPTSSYLPPSTITTCTTHVSHTTALSLSSPYRGSTLLMSMPLSLNTSTDCTCVPPLDAGG